jgi:glucosamine--fructose-6-phosphate aminotransferase (isomerizing)
MEAEIRAQSEVLHTDFESQVPGWWADDFQCVLLAARGSSDNAALYARYLFEIHFGIPVILAAPSVWTRYKRDIVFPKCLAIGISQSGAAPDVSEVIAQLRADGHRTLAITNTPDSRLDRVAERTVHLGVGAETSIAATKTYSATVAALYAIGRKLRPGLEPLQIPGNSWIDEMRECAEVVTGHVVRCQPSFVLGRGYSFSTAMETALKLMECALLPSKPYSSADFEHGPKALAGPGSVAISFDGPKPNLEENGCQILTCPVPKGVPEVQLPIWQVIFGQWLALHCARARGLNPDDARFLAKVTETH